MNKEIVIALLSGLLAMVGLAFTLWGQLRVRRLDHDFDALRTKAEAERTSSQYREPLARAAADLQSRLFNILERGFVERFLVGGSPREQQYASSNTVFLFAQFFAWTEAARLEIQFISLDEDAKTRELSALQSRIYSILQSDRYPPGFMLFPGEQRALGERMLTPTKAGSRCLRYSDFLSKGGMSDDSLLSLLHEAVEGLKERKSEAIPRLIAFQHALVELLEFLDPHYLRFPREERSKYWVAGALQQG
jgi:hypothetical protein